MASHQALLPWHSPGKNTGVGCHFLLQCMKVKSESKVSLSRVRPSATPWTAAYQAPPSMGFSRQEYWSGVPFYYFPLFVCIDLWRRLSFFSLALLCNSAFQWIYLSFSPLPFTSLFFPAICKPSSDNHFAFLHFFFLGMVLITASCTMSPTSVHSSLGTLSEI